MRGLLKSKGIGYKFNGAELQKQPGSSRDFESIQPLLRGLIEEFPKITVQLAAGHLAEILAEAS